GVAAASMVPAGACREAGEHANPGGTVRRRLSRPASSASHELRAVFAARLLSRWADRPARRPAAARARGRELRAGLALRRRRDARALFWLDWAAFRRLAAVGPELQKLVGHDLPHGEPA